MSDKQQTSNDLLRIIRCDAPATPRLLRVCSAFGLGVFGPPPSRVCKAQLHGILRATMTEGQIVHLSGASGCGKSTLLRAVVRRLREDGREVIVARRGSIDDECSLVDAMPGSIADALAALNDAGLSDATLYPRSISELSEGQRARAHLAWVLATERKTVSFDPVVLVVDELASTLDALTARAICISLRKAVEHRRAVLISASAREEVGPWLCATTPLVAGSPQGNTNGVQVHLRCAGTTSARQQGAA